MQKEIVRLEKVSLSLRGNAGEVRILNDISFHTAKGQKLAVAGPSGSGKTSLLMLIAGLERPTTGQITVCDTPYHTASEETLADLRNRQIGIVFQAFHLIPTLTALENVSLPLELAGVKDARARAEAALADMGLAARTRHFPAELSGGEQQRVAIARAFAPQPQLLLADEPTGNLDRTTGELVIDRLFDLCERSGTTLILVTHDAALASRCDRRIGLDSGRMVP